MKASLTMMKLSKMQGASAVRVALLALCTATMGALVTKAQDAPPAGPPSGQGPGGPGGGMRGGGMPMERMTKELNLTPDQVTLIKQIQADGMKEMMALRDDTSMSQGDKRPKMMAMREAQSAKVKAVLNDDQKVKYDEMMKSMQGRRGGGGPPPPPSTPPLN